MNDILVDLADLYEQATTERSHFYTAKCTSRAITEITRLREACRLHKAWADSDAAGPDYGGQSRDTHPDGEKIWRAWWNNQLDLCRRANDATDAALTQATEQSI